ncbi:MAG: TetM/TetW/TetO/TetS family tetracycline resistance ribosomal protection protein [Oscillospiraceae bacterium]|jgi:small GTP-binding protein|nr:TetM/TetW/TetO/TetS family tetracycline resistance ribosomal protection protein [Oscillospiraceae bacterium]
MKHLVIGIFAQVDAGKTTLSESLLYCAGQLKRLGRVDHGNAFVDYHALERSRGITIFSKQARFQTPDLAVTLVDTPGHVDFSPEAERSMQVLDYAVLLISGTDGVQAHTQTLWELLRRYHIPTFLFFNKMDLPGAEPAQLLREAQATLSEQCLRPSDSEALALCDDALLDRYLRGEAIADCDIASLVQRELLFPCYFGSALKLEGVQELLEGLQRFSIAPTYGSAFSAIVYKISHEAGRLTFLKVAGGELHVRDTLSYTAQNGEQFEEKVSQLRLYSGSSFETAACVHAGTICAVPGLSALRAGDVLGATSAMPAPLLTPVMSYRIALPEGSDVQAVLPKLRTLEDEEPQLRIVWDERLREIRAQLMGEVQIEVLRSLILSRLSLDVTIDSGAISYRETIAQPVEGVGHFEPLRHYAEVHLLLEPLARGSGLHFGTSCSGDVLDRNWQRLILTHLEEKTHRGVLQGAPITDMRITLTAGRAHLKHTEGGDFRQATYRAVRQGLMQAQSVLLEPYYRFELRVPPEQIGRAINDLRAMGGSFESPDSLGDLLCLRGDAPVSSMRNYMAELTAYTHGKGRLSCVVEGYAPCHNAAKVLEENPYDPEADLENSPDSVFCAHGAGFTVKWNQVHEYMHLAHTLRPPKPDEPVKLRTQNLNLDEKALQAIIEREFGSSKRAAPRPPAPKAEPAPAQPPKREYLIVDGYNMIFSWEGLREQAQYDLDGARKGLLDILSNFCGYHPCELVVVFDSYRVKGGVGAKQEYHNLRVVFTRENESADLYIEGLLAQIGKNYAVRVATSDALIQLSALRSGVLRVSANELLLQVQAANSAISAILRRLQEDTIKNHPQCGQKEGKPL